MLSLISSPRPSGTDGPDNLHSVPNSCHGNRNHPLNNKFVNSGHHCGIHAVGQYSTSAGPHKSYWKATKGDKGLEGDKLSLIFLDSRQLISFLIELSVSFIYEDCPQFRFARLCNVHFSVVFLRFSVSDCSLILWIMLHREQIVFSYISIREKVRDQSPAISHLYIWLRSGRTRKLVYDKMAPAEFPFDHAFSIS